MPNINWIKVNNKEKDKLPAPNRRILVYSKCYKGMKDMEYRILDSQFLPICKDVTHWAYLTEPESEQWRWRYEI